jgi:hypothetical protein
MENGKNNTLTQNDILEGIRTLNAIYSAMMIGSQVAIEKFIAKKKIPRNARKFFISEMARSLDQIPDVRQQLEQGQMMNMSKNMNLRQVGGAWPVPKIPGKFNPLNYLNRNKNGSVSVSTPSPTQLQGQPQPIPLPLDATQPPNEIIPIAELVDDSDTNSVEAVNHSNNEDDGSVETQQEMEKEYIDALVSTKMMLGKSILKKIIQVSSNIVERIIDYTTGGILNKPPAELTGETNKIILVLSMVLKDLSTDERQIQAMKDISEALTKTFLDVMDVIAPTIKQIVGKTFDNISSIGMQGASGSMRVFISMSKAAISEIPIVGGIINLILAFGESFNVFSKIVSTLMTRGSHMSNDVVNAFMQARAKFEESFARHKLNIEKTRRAIDTLTNPIQSTVDTVAETVNTLNPSVSDQSEVPFVPLSIPRGKGLFDNRSRQEKAIDLVNQKATTELKNAKTKEQLVSQSNAELETRRQLLKAQQEATKQRQDAYNVRNRANKQNVLSKSFSNMGQRIQNFKDNREQTQIEKSISKLEKQYELDKTNADIAQEKANKARERASALNLSFSQKQEAERAKKEAEEQLTESNRKLKEAEDNLRKEVGPTRLEKFKGLFTRKKTQKGGKRKTKRIVKYKRRRTNVKYKRKYKSIKKIKKRKCKTRNMK